jgi:hypothetical protein
MRERRTTSRRRRPPRTPDELAAAIGTSRRRALSRRVAPELLAALAGSIESVAATAGPVVEATADAVRGDDLARQEERLAVALRNLEAAISEAAGTVRAALRDIEGPYRRPPRHK